ncbi:ABC transporter ATP-binding protein [Rhodoferax sp.]|uniref:ABC transporter ATP-binding protein n=1 Tax=Rhodoferax sp. TaxID=50421 RepID=UPI0027184E3E|nr:ABC transporter ATP-binding protein [Rhodoferax sp.]MDO9198707.1 ABC transporter ATP-binding protein [Rhodoferax sp.]
MNNNPAPSVHLENATFSYPGGKAGVFDITLDIAPGELIVCIGPSGCGKTTLLKLIAGFFPCTSGRVYLGGEDVTLASVRSRQCGIVFQSYALFPHMRVWENVAYPLRVRDIAVAERRRRADAMLDMVGLGGFGERLPAELSGGQQQRVALARALVFKPRALLLDEPLSALDAATRVTMRDEIRRIQKQQNIAALLITHDQDEALSLADRIAVLRDGRLVQVAPPQELYDRPADAFVASFVGRANLIDGRVAAPDAVDTPLGRIATPAHALAMGTLVRLLVRPEKIEPARTATGENIFAATVVHDRFFGASREIELAVGQGMLKIDTTTREAIAHIHVPRQAVQFLPTH